MEWAPTIERANQLTDAQRRQRVNDEWSLVETTRHLVFAIDKWFTVPRGGGCRASGMPNTGDLALLAEP